MSFNILCDGTGGTQKALLLHTRECGHLEEKRMCSCLSCELSSLLLSQDTAFISKNNNQLWLLIPGFLIDILLKMHEVNMSLQENN